MDASLGAVIFAAVGYGFAYGDTSGHGVGHRVIGKVHSDPFVGWARGLCAQHLDFVFCSPNRALARVRLHLCACVPTCVDMSPR